MLHIDDQVMTELVQLVGGHARLDVGGDVIEYLAGQAAGDAHFLDFLRGLDGDWHTA